MTRILPAQPVRQRQPRQPDNAWLKTFRGRACEACGGHTEDVVPAHLTDERYSIGAKPDDRYVVALCMGCHDILDRRVRGNREQLLARIAKTLAAKRYERWKETAG